MTAGNGLGINNGSGSITISLDTPGTLSATSTNGVTTDSHTHGITATDTGSASTLVKTGSDGSIMATDTFKFGLNASIKYNSATKSLDFIFA